MINRIGNIVIMVLLLIATSGIPITRHYCGSSAATFSIYSSPKPCCDSHCGKCHNIFKLSKVTDDFEAGSAVNTQILNDIVNHHSTIFIDLFDNYLNSSFSEIINQRTFLNADAGHSPASLGNFRC